MRNGDQTIRDALKKAQAVLCRYLEPDGPNENQTVKQLFGILNDQEVIRALEDSERPRGRRTSATARRRAAGTGDPPR
jgi:hypothetical protein